MGFSLILFGSSQYLLHLFVICLDPRGVKLFWVNLGHLFIFYGAHSHCSSFVPGTVCGTSVTSHSKKHFTFLLLSHLLQSSPILCQLLPFAASL